MKQSILQLAQRLRSDNGNALIELAVGMTVLTTIILGAAELGRVAYASIEINDAARAGASYGAANRTYAADTANITNAAKKDAPDVGGVTATANYWCKCSDGSASTCGATDCTGTRIIEYLTVTTTGTVDPMIYVPGLPHTYTINGSAVMRVEQ
jgi:Flp pilus assembly protein TadG